MKKVYVSWSDVQRQTQEICRQISLDSWRPDYVVGITRGGLVPANLISEYLSCRMETLKVKLHNLLPGESCETNCWMAEDAIGYLDESSRNANGGWTHLPRFRKNILIVDDINDSGATLNWIKQDWAASVAGVISDSEWNEIWGQNVRVAVLYDNDASNATVPISYSATNINTFDDSQQIIFPWQEWWRR